jgi:hypothetical protein
VTDEAPRTDVIFIVRTTREPGGRVRGVVERVSTGQKERFSGVRSLGRLIDRMLAATAERRARR